MKYISLKPSVKLVFMACIATFLISPKMLLAQSSGDIDIEFHGRDTLVNGVNMRDLSTKDRKAARAQIAVLDRLSHGTQSKAAPHDSVPKAATNNLNASVGAPKQASQSIGSTASVPPSVTPMAAPAGVASSVVPSSITPTVASAGISPMVVAPIVVPQGTAPAAVTPAPLATAPASAVPQNGGAQAAVTPASAPAAVAPAHELERNTQIFDYTNISKEGISTHIYYYVSEPSHSDAQQIIGAFKPGLEIQDMSLVPQFWAGKTLLTFSLPDKTPADVEITDNEGKPLWNDRITSPVFSKSFSWTLNGTYYLVVKQGGETAIKKVVKK